MRRFAFVMILILCMLPMAAIQIQPSRHGGGGFGGSYWHQDYGSPFIAFSIRTEYAFPVGSPGTEDRTWNFLGLAANSVIVIVLFVALLQTIWRLSTVEKFSFGVAHMLQAVFAVSVCLAFRNDPLGWVFYAADLLSTRPNFYGVIGVSLWQTIALYCYLFAFIFAVPGWIASVFSKFKTAR